MKKDDLEPWLRGPVPGVPPLLQPAAHALIAANEDVRAAVKDLGPDALWARPGGAASVGFHLAHVSGSTDRLLTYARGEGLDEAQLAALDKEKRLDEERPPLTELLAGWDQVVEAALDQLRGTEESSLSEERLVGRAQIPSTVGGLLFHAAEHAARHAGQLVTTVRVLRNG